MTLSDGGIDERSHVRFVLPGPMKWEAPVMSYTKFEIDPNTQERVEFSRRYPLGLRDFVKMMVRHEQLIETLRYELQRAEKRCHLYETSNNSILAKASRDEVVRIMERLKTAMDHYAKTQACNPRLAMSIRLEWAEER